MLAIRMQRTGRKGHAMFRVIVQDSQRTPTSGKIVARLGSYDPHAKTVTLDKEKAGFYLEHGAQPSERVAILLKKEGVKLPDWVKLPPKAEGKTRNPDKRRSTRPEEPAGEKPAEEAPAAETEQAEAEAPATPEETAVENVPEEEAATETPAEPAETEKAPADTTEETADDAPKAETSSDSTDEKTAEKDTKSDK